MAAVWYSRLVEGLQVSLISVNKYGPRQR